MNDLESVKEQIEKAFEAVEYPGDWNLAGSREGDEPYLLVEEFKGRNDWHVLEAEFLDQAPGGFGSALSFFSDEAFLFYLPAYLLADLDNRLTRVDPVFHLTHGLDDESRHTRINPRRYGERTWIDYARYKFSILNRSQVAAIVAYLAFKRDSDRITGLEKRQIEEALRNYWSERLT